MKTRVDWVVVVGFVAMLGVACAKPAIEESIPAHPFPLWVSDLESGRSEIGEVRERFGPPDEIEQSVRGGTIWRYVFREIDWPKSDPMRPVVALDGTLQPRKASTSSRVGHGFLTAWRWIDAVMFYPPRQSRPPRTRRLPATVHQLEVVFGVDGTLRRLKYSPTRGFARVPARS